MIVTVTLNPSLDRTLSVPKLEPGMIHRAQFIRQDLGGKGINVSRALHALDIPSRIVGFVGGWTGNALQTGLTAEGFDVRFIKVNGDTRQNLTLLDEASGKYTKINEPGPTIDSSHILALGNQIAQTILPGDLWTFCGSLPPGSPPDLYSHLIRQTQERRGLAFLDTSGTPLRHALSALPFVAKINNEEAAELLGRALDSDQDMCAAAREIHTRGVRVVALTRGAQGLVLAMDGEVVTAVPPCVTARSSVGAGDAAMAGLLWAVLDHCDPAETARRVVACGTAAAMQEGTTMGDRALISTLLHQIQITCC
jgi:1-phosphofructokinase